MYAMSPWQEKIGFLCAFTKQSIAENEKFVYSTGEAHQPMHNQNREKAGTYITLHDSGMTAKGVLPKKISLAAFEE